MRGRLAAFWILGLSIGAAVFVTVGNSDRVTATPTASTTVPPRPVQPGTDGLAVNLNPDGFGGSIETPGGETGGGREVRSGPPIDCDWTRFRVVSNSGDTEGLGSFLTGQGAEEVNQEGNALRAAGTEILYWFQGDDCAFGHAWVSTTINARDLLPPLRDHFDEVLAEPVPNMSPAPEIGTLVNLGLWIAVEDPGVVTDTASDGPVWAQGTGTHTRITMDFGNGDTEVCEGLGTPIADTSIREEGPCGYTFTKTNRPASTFPVTLTSTYTVTYRLSNGESGVLGTVDRSINFDYEVTEVQAVGSG